MKKPSENLTLNVYTVINFDTYKAPNKKSTHSYNNGLYVLAILK